MAIELFAALLQPRGEKFNFTVNRAHKSRKVNKQGFIYFVETMKTQ